MFVVFLYVLLGVAAFLLFVHVYMVCWVLLHVCCFSGCVAAFLMFGFLFCKLLRVCCFSFVFLDYCWFSIVFLFFP